MPFLPGPRLVPEKRTEIAISWGSDSERCLQNQLGSLARRETPKGSKNSMQANRSPLRNGEDQCGNDDDTGRPIIVLRAAPMRR
jgi:hypothetical protein